MEKGISGIYGLKDPDGRIRYVGQAKCVLTRYKGHCRLSNNRSQTKRCNWLRSVLESGAKPGVVVLEKTANLDAAEIRWVGYLRNHCDLTNTAEAGKSTAHAEKQRLKMPWAPGYSPYRKAVTMMRWVERSRRESGDCEGADRMAARVEEIARKVKRFRKDPAAWILFNLELALRHERRGA